jgi:chromosome segregation protein
LKEEQERLKEKETHHQGIIEQHQKLIHQLNVLEVQDLESVQQQQRLEEEVEGARAFQKEMQEKLEKDAEYLEEVKKALEEVEEASTDLEHEVADHKHSITEVEATLDAAREEIKQLESKLYEIGIEMTQISGNREGIEADLQERYGLTIDDLREQEITLEMGTEEAEKRIRKLRRLLDDSGDINMASIEEFEELKERYEFLNQQLDDLAVSKQELVEIISRLDVESRKMFEETFEQVRANFRKNFTILFSGGEADLRFTESEDILTAGIDIVAKPPGKQMRNISLLSGGEKCLTAMALLFAIFEVKAAPFCILDEVDAPLDDSNIARFVNVVKQFTDQCQFVIITHNKRTMAICDRLFGVSMQERGVSKLLSIEFNKEKVPEPTLV